MTSPLDHLAVTPAGAVRAIVVSDIHAVASGTGSQVSQAEGDPSLNALLAAQAAIADSGMTADLLLCPGDLVDRGAVAPMPWVWARLQEIAAATGAALVATVGNHDVERKTSGQRPQEALRALRPLFPGLDNRDRSNQYWSENFTVARSPDNRWRVVALDTCGLTGYDPDAEDRGLLPRATLDRLREVLAADEPAEVNVLMCHHQPLEWTQTGDTKTSHIERGDLLIDLLDHQPESWMLLHGHKHEPRLDYFAHGTNGSVRFAAGSLGVAMSTGPMPSLRNQFHVVDFQRDAGGLGMNMAGTIHSFDWATGLGWEPADARSGLAPRAGFGFRREGPELAQWLRRNAVSGGLAKRLQWQAILDAEPRAEYLAPRDVDGLARAVERPRMIEGVSTRGTATREPVTGQLVELSFP